MSKQVDILEEDSHRVKNFTDIMNMVQILDLATKHLAQMRDSPEVQASRIKIRETVAFFTTLRENFDKAEVARARALEAASTKEWEARKAASDAEVAKFNKEQEERIAKRAAEIVEENTRNSKVEPRAPDHPEPN